MMEKMKMISLYKSFKQRIAKIKHKKNYFKSGQRKRIHMYCVQILVKQLQFTKYLFQFFFLNLIAGETLLLDFLMSLFPKNKQSVVKIFKDYLQQFQVKMETFEEKQQYVLQNYCDPIQYPYGITIDDKIITDQSITSVFKSFFCHRCYIYDCKNHENKKELNFTHPLTQLNETKKYKDIKWLQAFYQDILQAGKKYQYIPNPQKKTLFSDFDLDKQPCSKSCYLNLTLESFEKLKSEKTYNEFQIAYIKSGIKHISYNPCNLNLIDRKFTCSEIFIYLVKNENILSKQQENKVINKKIKPSTGRGNKILFNKEMYYEPCCHYHYDEEPKDVNCQDCGCSTRGFCDIYCGCDPLKCKRRRQGCRCVKGSCKTKKCACYFMGMECDPEHCKDCFDCRKDTCKNNEYLYQRQERTVIGMSFVCQGLGLYSVYPIQQHSLVLSYLGEYISEDEQVIRESWLKSDIFYTFTKNDFEKLVDSKYFGNKLENCFARSVYSRGDYHLGLYAKQDIPPGNELLFDYDADRTLAVEKEWITKNSTSNYKIRKDNIRIIIPRNKDLTKLNNNVIVVDEENKYNFIASKESSMSIPLKKQYQRSQSSDIIDIKQKLSMLSELSNPYNYKKFNKKQQFKN